MIPALLALEDGSLFEGMSFTGPGEAWGEMVFNTSMTGYQEVLTDPSYKGQMVAMTYPLMGNYGINPEDIESDRIQVEAFVVREYLPFPSNWRSKKTLRDYLTEAGVLGVEGMDTRALTRVLRNVGAMRGMVSTRDLEPNSLIKRARAIPAMAGQNLVPQVTTPKPFFWKDGKKEVLEILTRKIWRKGKTFRVAAMDYGIKYNILRNLEARGCQVLVLPADTPTQAIRSLMPDGLFLSNGPGDPAALTGIVSTIQDLIGEFPTFGICLGHQILGLALGGKTFKLKFGHRGVNQPVMDLRTGKVDITSQNHGFCVDLSTLNEAEVELTHINLNDRTLEGLRHRKYPLFSVQYHPEAGPGPHDATYLFDQFVGLMKAEKR